MGKRRKLRDEVIAAARKVARVNPTLCSADFERLAAALYDLDALDALRAPRCEIAAEFNRPRCAKHRTAFVTGCQGCVAFFKPEVVEP